MAEVYLRRLSRWQAEQERNTVADVYVGAYRGAAETAGAVSAAGPAGAAGTAYGDRQGFLHRLEQHVRHTGFDMVVADVAGTVGCAYGFRVPPAGEWWTEDEDIRGELPADVGHLTASGRTFLLAELMVLPAHRRRGIATRMVEQLLIRLDAELVVATTSGSGDGGGGDGGHDPGGAGDTDGAAETFRAWGWSRSPVPATGAPAAAREIWLRRPLR